MSKRLYVSGPMTGLPEHNFPAFRAAAAELRAAGYEVEDPAEKGIVEGWEWEDYLRYDLRALMDCAGVALLPGFENSRGAQLELYVATALGMEQAPVNAWVVRAACVTGPSWELIW